VNLNKNVMSGEISFGEKKIPLFSRIASKSFPHLSSALAGAAMIYPAQASLS
jgi:hypothetical protein